MQSKFNCSKNYPRGRWLLCKPTFYTVKYEINPWMDIKVVTDNAIANRQWDELVKTFKKLGSSLDFLEPVEGSPDLVFTANGGLVKNNKVVVSRFNYDERRAEEKYFRDWFDENNFEIIEVEPYSFEGEGDAEFAGDVLFAAHGFRSSKKVYDSIKEELGIKKIVHCELVDPYFYHIDTCFRPITEDKALVYEPAFTKDSLTEMSKNIELIKVSEKDAKQFVCNAVVIDKDVILAAECHDTYEKLESLGFSAHPVNLNEFLKAGGSAKCLTLRIDR